MRKSKFLAVGVCCAALCLLAVGVWAVTDDMEQNLWTLGHINPNYDGTWVAEYSKLDAVSPERSIRLKLDGGGTAGRDGDEVFATRVFTGQFVGCILSLAYNVAQQTDVNDSWGGLHGSADVIVSALDSDDKVLGTHTYRLACSDLHEKPAWYNSIGGEAGSPCHQTTNITYIGDADDGGEYEPGPGWQTLSVVPSQDMDVDWSDVASLRVKLAVSACFMHLDTFEVFFDDLSIEPVPAAVDIDPDTLNLKSKGNWVTAYIGLPEGYKVEDIDVSTIGLEGIPAVRGNVSEGVLMVKFDRDALIALIKEMGLALPAQVDLTVTGFVGDIAFKGADTIRVIEKGK